MAKFKQTNFNVVLGDKENEYYIVTNYKGVDINYLITDNNTLKYVNDNSNKAKQGEALRYCYNIIRKEYDANKDSLKKRKNRG
jgi:hypothetical protein